MRILSKFSLIIWFLKGAKRRCLCYTRGKYGRMFKRCKNIFRSIPSKSYGFHEKMPLCYYKHFSIWCCTTWSMLLPKLTAWSLWIPTTISRVGFTISYIFGISLGLGRRHILNCYFFVVAGCTYVAGALSSLVTLLMTDNLQCRVTSCSPSILMIFLVVKILTFWW